MPTGGGTAGPGSALRAGRPCSLLLCTGGRRPIPSICSREVLTAAPASPPPPVSITASADPRPRGTPGQSPGQSGVGEATPQRSVPGNQAQPQLCPPAQQSWSPRGHSPPDPTKLPALGCHLGTPGLRAQGCNLRVVCGGTSSGSLWFDPRVGGAPALRPIPP